MRKSCFDKFAHSVGFTEGNGRNGGRAARPRCEAKSAWVVRKYGVRLMPELYEHLNPMPFEAAVQMETELAEDLRAAGYTVTGGH